MISNITTLYFYDISNTTLLTAAQLMDIIVLSNRNVIDDNILVSNEFKLIIVASELSLVFALICKSCNA